MDNFDWFTKKKKQKNTHTNNTREQNDNDGIHKFMYS